jgi:hypothetical protein
MQSLLRVTFAGFQPAVLGVKHQATGVQQPSVVGQLAQTQTTDVLGAMPHYRPLPIGVRSGTGEGEELLTHLNKAIREKTIEKADRLKDATASMEKIKSVVESLLGRTLAPTSSNNPFMTHRIEAIAKLVDELKQNQADQEDATAIASILKLENAVNSLLNHTVYNQSSYDALTVKALTMLKESVAELAGILKK